MSMGMEMKLNYSILFVVMSYQFHHPCTLMLCDIFNICIYECYGLDENFLILLFYFFILIMQMASF